MNLQTANSPTDAVADAAQPFRTQLGHISRNSGLYLAGIFFNILLGYLFKIYLARTLGAVALGVYALGLTFVGFIGVFNTLGLMPSAVRFTSIYRSSGEFEKLRALLWRGGAILLLANVFFGALFLIFGGKLALRFYQSPALAHYVPWFAALMILGIITTFYSRVLAGYKQVGRRTLIINFVGTPATMLFSIALIGLGWGLRGYLLAQVLGSIVVIILLVGFVWKLTPRMARPRLQWSPPIERAVWSFSVSAFGILLLDFLMAQVDKVALGIFRGAREVGIYSVAAGMVAYISVILNSVNQVFSPLVAELHNQRDSAMLARLYKSLARWILALTLPLAITVMVFARPLLRIFGHDFEAGWPVLIIGTTGQLINCGVGSVGLILMMSGNQGRLLRVQAFMAGLMTAASLVLVPTWGIVGAAAAAAAANIGSNSWNLWEVRKVLGLSPFTRSYMRLFVPTISTVMVTILVKHEAGVFRHDWLAVATALLTSYVAFGVAVVALGLDSDDRLVIHALWERVRVLLPSAKGANFA